MTPYIHEYTADIRSGMLSKRERNPVGQGDSLADVFVVSIVNGGQPVPLDGVGVSATVIRPDGVTVGLVGSVTDGAATVTLDKACYEVPGEIVVTVSVSAGDAVQSVLRATLNVVTRETGVTAETDVLDLTLILAELANVRAAGQEALAAAEDARQAAEEARDAAASGGGGSLSVDENGDATIGGAGLTVNDSGDAVIGG